MDVYGSGGRADKLYVGQCQTLLYQGCWDAYVQTDSSCEVWLLLWNDTKEQNLV